MIRTELFRISKRPYAIDLSGLRTSPAENASRPMSWIHVPAVWFRRRRGSTVANIGHLWDLLDDPAPPDSREAADRMTDGRYGGTCEGRWDGERYWGAQEPAEIERHLAILRPALEGYPAVPPGYDGWYYFKDPRSRS